MGTVEILTQFSTLYPYLMLIASENNIKNPFDTKVVEAYWLGNRLLQSISKKIFARHLKDKINLKGMLKIGELNHILEKLDKGALPHHAFHVMNIYRRTGHPDIPHTVETMDACIINWGRVEKVFKEKFIICTQSLAEENNKLVLKKNTKRRIVFQGYKDMVGEKVKEGDYISYHWGMYCQKLTRIQLRNLIYYTSLAMRLANDH